MRREGAPLALRLVFLGKQLDHLIERRLASRGVNRTQAIALMALRRRPGLKALDLCPHTSVEPASVTRTLQSLERLGLLERHPHPTDGRANLFYLTAAGDAMARDLSEEVQKFSAELLQDAEPSDTDCLEKGLDSLRRAVRDQLSAVSHQPSAWVASGMVENKDGHAG